VERRIETKRRATKAQLSRYRSLGFDTVLNSVQNLLNRRSLRLKLIRMDAGFAYLFFAHIDEKKTQALPASFDKT